MATLATPIRSRTQFEDPACVKVVCNDRSRALYFSRASIPYPRQWDERLIAEGECQLLQHLGLYAYRREFLIELAAMPSSRLEQIEQLEQLRAIEAGEEIVVGVIAEASVGIDTSADYDTFVERTRSKAL